MIKRCIVILLCLIELPVIAGESFQTKIQTYLDLGVLNNTHRPRVFLLFYLINLNMLF